MGRLGAMEILLELIFQFFFEVIGDVLLGHADFAAGGRRRVLAFALAGCVGGLLSCVVRPQPLVTGRWLRWALIAALTLAGGVVLAFFESRICRGGPRSAVRGFLSGTAFSLMYVLVRRWGLG